MLSRYAVVVAGGSGSRMGAEIPKQFIPMGNRPILCHTLQRFYDADSLIKIIAVLPASEIAQWEKICSDLAFSVPHQVVKGGQSRFQSVGNGLKAITDNDSLVAIHDGVRPFLTKKVLLDSYDMAERDGSAVTCVPLKESLRILEGVKSSSLDRSVYRTVQTPQTFKTELIKKAFSQKEESWFTDDASVYEAFGGEISLTSGDYRNIKITTPEDLIWAESLLANFIE